MDKFPNRAIAGQLLASKLAGFADQANTIVLALPRGGIPIGFEVSTSLNLPLDAFLVRKLGVPGQEELAMGAIAMGDVCVLNDDIVQGLGISQAAIAAATQAEREELARRNQLYREGKPPPVLKDQTVILVDDGLATGATMRAAVTAINAMQPKKVIIAVPVSAADTCHAFEDEVDDVICLATPEPFYAVGMWYDEFPQTSDEEVIGLLAKATDVTKRNKPH